MKGVYETVGKSFSVMWVFMAESLEEILIWLVVMFSVVLCDLVTGCRKSLLMNEEIRISSAFRRTMGKMLTYFSFVLMAVFIDRASDTGYNLDKWSILFICFLEFCSIISNILRPKGYDLNPLGLLKLITKKTMNIECEDINTIVKKTNKSDKTKKE